MVEKSVSLLFHLILFTLQSIHFLGVSFMSQIANIIYLIAKLFHTVHDLWNVIPKSSNGTSSFLAVA